MGGVETGVRGEVERSSGPRDPTGDFQEDEGLLSCGRGLEEKVQVQPPTFLLRDTGHHREPVCGY